MGGFGRYFSNSSAVRSATKLAQTKKQTQNDKVLMESPLASEVSWSDIFDKELTLKPERGPGFEPEVFRFKKLMKDIPDNFDMYLVVHAAKRIPNDE